MKKLNRVIAFMLTVILCLAEFAGTGISAKSAGSDVALPYVPEVKATADVITPTLGGKVSGPEISLLSPTGEGVSVYGVGWQKSKGLGEWEDYHKAVFEEGTFRPVVQVYTEAYKPQGYEFSDRYYYHVVSYSTKLIVDGVAWKPCGKIKDFYEMSSSGWLYYAGPEYKVTLPSGHHSIIVESEGSGSAKASKVSAANGDVVELSASPSTGYIFKEWVVVYGNVTVTNNKFVMKSGNVKIKAVFESAYIEKGTITEVSGGATYKEPTVGESVGRPKTYVYDPANKGVGIKDATWYVLGTNGKYVKCNNGDSFLAGSKYRLRVTLYSSALAYGQYWWYYRLAGNVKLKMKDTEWTKISDLRDTYKYSGYGEITFEGPEIEAIEDRNLSGTVYYTTAVEAGNIIGLGFDGKLNDLAFRNIPMHYTWQRAEDKEGPWTDIDDSDNRTYQPGADDVGKYIRVSVTADGYVGNVTSSERLVERRENNAAPLQPGLSTEDPFTSIMVTGTRASQEYVMKTSSVAVTEEEWNSLSRSPEKDGNPIVFDLGETEVRDIYISTRYKETDISKAGTNVLQLCIYAGSSSAVNGIVLDKRKVDMTTGDVVELTVRPDPVNASAWVGNNWVTWSVADEKECLKLYLDPECSITYDKTNLEHQNVNTVYVKAVSPDYWAAVRVTRNTFSDECRFTIVDENGEVPLTSLSFPGATVHAGETAMLEYKRFPENGKVGNISIAPINPGSPDIIFSKGDIGDTVKAVVPASAPEGTYQYTVSYKAYEYGHLTDKNTSLYITVDNSITAVEEVGIAMEEYTARPGESFKLSAYVCPADAGDGTISWSVSDTSAATVDNGKVTIKDDVKDGTSFNVIAKAGNQLGICSVKVYKEKMVYVVDSYAEVPGTGKYMPGETVKLQAGVSENKVFDRWETNEAVIWYSYAPDGSFEMPQKDVVVCAVWKDAEEAKEACTVSFNMCGHGTAPEAQLIAIGQPAEKPADPVEEGYDFLGWYTEEAYTNAYDFGTPVTKDIILYAKWEEAASAMNPIPEIKADTKELYLVKGQAFTLPEGGKWKSDTPKAVKITKKGT
ncbi:MAG: InlB B-repeat-containing protein, partial [Lachnospiraceae bacterium]|nr:InlB B-repeat-containing protein [Lachnospiraceae bacterium]